MNPTLRAALHGFSDFEQRALGSFFRLATPPALGLELVPDIACAQLVVADTVFIGVRAPQGAAALLSRPIDALHVLREIESLAAQRRVPPPAAREPAVAASAATQRAAASTVPQRHRAALPAAAAAAAAAGHGLRPGARQCPRAGTAGATRLRLRLHRRGAG